MDANVHDTELSEEDLSINIVTDTGKAKEKRKRRKQGVIKRVGSDIGGHWEICKKDK